jgi:RNA polymerase subunit RPABC4/transcription elongation factor Spt4
MKECGVCGHALPRGAKFCGSCGNPIALPQNSFHNLESLETTCVNCGVLISTDALFCPACGEAVDAAEFLTGTTVVNSLVRILTPSGATVLSNKSDKWKAQRLEICADIDGLFTPSDKIRMQDLIRPGFCRG